MNPTLHMGSVEVVHIMELNSFESLGYRVSIGWGSKNVLHYFLKTGMLDYDWLFHWLHSEHEEL